MIKIKIYELEKHRNETTFRPYIVAQNLFREIGIEFTTQDSYDYAWIGQASFCDKKIPLSESVDRGLKFLDTITGPYFLFDGQDSTSLMGSYEVLKNSKAIYLLKNSLLKDRSLYKKGWVNGRMYWGPGEYAIKDFDKHSSRIKLSGSNWLSTVVPNWFRYNLEKQYDVAALFSYPMKAENVQHGLYQNTYYNGHRSNCINVVNKISSKFKIARLPAGRKLPPQEYAQTMYNSKIILSPYGFGEMNPRDVQAVMYGSILIEPDMSYIESEPMWYEENRTYIPCKHDFSDLEEKIDYVLSNYSTLQEELTEYARIKFEEKYNLSKRVLHIYNLFKELPGIS